MRRVNARLAAAVALTMAAGPVWGAKVAPGDLVILQSLGDASVAAQTAVPVQLQEFSTAPNSLAVQSVNVATSGVARLTIGASTGTEGLLTYNDGYIGFAGYDADPGTAAVFGTATNAPRRLVAYDTTQDLSSGPQFNAITTLFNNGNIRTALYSKAISGAYAVGAISGIIYQTNGATSGGTNIASGSPAAAYAVAIYNGNTYFTIQNGTRGIYSVTGTPTTEGNATAIYTPTPKDGNNNTAVTGYNFWISPDGGTVYEAADPDVAPAGNGGQPTGGIKKYTRAGDGTWSLAYTISTDYDGAGSATTGVRSISVDNSGAQPLIYATTSDRQKLISITDTGTAAGAAATLSVLQTAASGTQIRSAVFIPHVPGDTNDSGTVNGDDYALIDKGFARYATGLIPAGTAVWRDGDYNHDGSVDAADYFVIDRAYATATGQLDPSLLDQRLAQFGQSYVDSLIASVPEPTTALLAVPAVALLGGRRRRV